jgi:hypothetical protein
MRDHIRVYSLQTNRSISHCVKRLEYLEAELFCILKTGPVGSCGTPDYTTLDAIDDCREGNTARSIPILEQKLHCSKVTPPRR